MLMRIDTKGLGKKEAERLSIERIENREASGMAMIIFKPGFEPVGRDSLRRRGIGAWWPNYPKEVQAKDRTTGQRYSRLVLAGVMPGIVFTPGQLSAQFWTAVDLAPGAFNVVRTLTGDIALIDDVDIVLLHKIEAELNRATPDKVVHNFEIGDEVRIGEEHAFKGFTAKIVKIDRRSGHIRLEIPMFGRMTAIVVLSHHIAPV